MDDQDVDATSGRRRGRPVTFVQLNDPAWLAARVDVRTAEIAREVGCTSSLVAMAFRRAGVDRASRRTSDAPVYPALRDPERLAGRTVRDVAIETGAATSTVRLAFRAAGLIPVRRTLRATRFPQLEDVNWLTARRKWAYALVAEEVGCSKSRAALAYKAAGIER